MYMYAFTHNVWLPACRGGMKFEPKWSLPLCDLSFSPPGENPEGKQQICLVKGRQIPPYFCVLAPRPVPVTSDMELSVMKNKIAELKAQLNKDNPRERSASSSGEKEPQGFTFVRATAACMILCLMITVGGPLQKRTLKGHISVIKSKQAEKMKKKLQEQVLIGVHVQCRVNCVYVVMGTCTCTVHAWSSVFE